jgi:hypothetical protein
MVGAFPYDIREDPHLPRKADFGASPRLLTLTGRRWSCRGWGGRRVGGPPADGGHGTLASRTDPYTFLPYSRRHLQALTVPNRGNLMVHPILAVIALGGLVYSFSGMCPPAIRFAQRVCYGAMLYLAWWCPWPAWVIFLACLAGSMFLIRLPVLLYQGAKMRRTSVTTVVADTDP